MTVAGAVSSDQIAVQFGAVDPETGVQPFSVTVGGSGVADLADATPEELRLARRLRRVFAFLRKIRARWLALLSLLGGLILWAMRIDWIQRMLGGD
ncbi:MAG: hypothetical protein OYL92_17890 [Acidobacteriota bacterium]|nr:hypothetical protein [Acidobacteriota bacterium]MDE3266836.1 hypothetical protein [Acidobacteriota bacterium]